MQANAIIVVALATLNALLVSILAGRKHYPAGNAVLAWITPIWLAFVANCLNKGSCGLLVWIEVARQAFTAIVLLIYTVRPDIMDNVKSLDPNGSLD